MGDMSLNGKRFTDQEVREILKKAVEGTPSRLFQEAEGLSLVELKAIGAEVGIDPERIEDAARSLVLGRPERRRPLLGAPTTLGFWTHAKGELSGEDTPEVLSLIRRIMGHQGTAADVHGSLEWKARSDAGFRYVTVSSRDGHTTIEGSANLSPGAVQTYVPLVIATLCIFTPFLIAFLKGGDALGLVLFLGFAPLLYAGLRAIWKRVSAKEAEKLERTVAEVARLVERSCESEE